MAALQIVSVVALPFALRWLGPRALAAYLGVWLLAIPLVLAPVARVLEREWVGAAFVFLTAASAEYLDDVFSVEQCISLGLVILSLVYLWRRRRDAWAVARRPEVLLLVIFLAQELVNGLAFAVDDPLHLFESRAALLACVMAGAVLARRPGGARLLPALVIAGALASVPVTLCETLDPDLTLFSFSQADGQSHRAGGLFAQANNVGMALSFAVVFAFVLRARRSLPPVGVAVVCAASSVGLLACASRGAMFAMVVAAAAFAWLAALARARRPPLVHAVLLAGVVCAAGPLFDAALPAVRHDLEAAGFTNTERLQDVVSVLEGSSEDLVEHDNHRVWLAQQALIMIGERPLFGYGTTNFFVRGDGLRSHNELLEILGENGLAGGLLYLAFLCALVRRVARAPAQERGAAGLVTLVWLIHHFDCHNMLEYRFMVLPIAYLCSLDEAPATATRTVTPSVTIGG